MKKFNIPKYYRSSVISEIKEIRQKNDPRKLDFKPTVLDYGSVRFHIARHFGFCFGVENAIEISYKAVEENPNKRIFLLSQMIHNPDVNNDLQKKGIRFIMDTSGNQLVNWDEISADDVVIIPAFGTTLAYNFFARFGFWYIYKDKLSGEAYFNQSSIVIPFPLDLEIFSPFSSKNIS